MIMKIECYISMKAFKKNPAKVRRNAQSQPVAVLLRNKAASYVIDSTSFEAMVDAAEQAQLMPLLRELIVIVEKGNYTIVDIDAARTCLTVASRR
jgi:PHD/YefM family antitoxin component YafN of YafNO toxin-antitoxin module